MSDQITYSNLVNTLINAERAYYQDGEPTMSDSEYDTLYRRVLAMEAGGKIQHSLLSPTQRVGPILGGSFEPVKHKRRMLSLDNCFNGEELTKFVRNINESLPQGEDFDLVLEPKIDGLALSLIYQNGKLISAATRGDGTTGENVLANARAIKSIPLVLAGIPPGIAEIRGEVYMPVSIFNGLNDQLKREGKALMSNPRNSAVGALKLKDAKESAKRKLAFLAYEIIGHGESFVDRIETHTGALLIINRLGFKTPAHLLCHRGIAAADLVKSFDEDRKRLDYWTDGTVLKLDRFKHRKIIGEGTKCPKWAIAAKFGSRSAITRLDDVTVQVGKTGALTPVAELKPLDLNGTIIKRASLHNYDEIERLGLKIGDTVEVEKAGEIIPKIIAKTDQQHMDSRREIEIPKNCPECGTKVVKDKSTIYCPNISACPAQVAGRLEHWCSDKAMAIDGGGPAMVEALIKTGCLNQSQIYTVNEDDLVDAGIGRRVAEKFLDAVFASKGSGLERVLYGLSIPYVGEGTAKRLASHFKNIESIFEAEIEDLIKIEDIGGQTAQAIVEWFGNHANYSVINQLRDLGVKLSSVQAEQQEGDALEGQTIVVSGTFSCGDRDYVKSMIEKHGGKATGSVSKKTSILVVGEEPGGSKVEKAQKFGTKIMTEDEFLTLINGAS